MNFKRGVESKRKCKTQESCVCIVGFSACERQKESEVYEAESRHEAVQRSKQDNVQSDCDGVPENESRSNVLNLLGKQLLFFALTSSLYVNERFSPEKSSKVLTIKQCCGLKLDSCGLEDST